jgi:proteasome lid subunit RPN8/RPN11
LVQLLKIGIAEYEQIRHHGVETYPDECCGILIGRFTGAMRVVLSIERCANVAPGSLRNRYSIDPHEVIGAQRNARGRGLEIVGFYHSHPDHPPQWSFTDLEEAHWIGCSYVISGISEGVAAETRSFELAGALEEDKSFAEEEIIFGS